MTIHIDETTRTDDRRHERWAEKEAWTSERFAQARWARGERRRRIEDEITIAHLGLVDSLAARIVGSGRELGDARQVGCVGLVKAVRRFEPERGVPFVPFAVPTIGGEIKRHLRDNGWFVRPPRDVQELRAEVIRATTDLSQVLVREPTVADIARHLGREVPEVVRALAADSSLRPTSLDAPLTVDDGTPFGQTIPVVDEAFDRVDLAISLHQAVRGLAARDQRIVHLRFVHHLTQQEIAQEIGVTQMQVSRLLTRILGTLREQLGDFAPPRAAGAA